MLAGCLPFDERSVGALMKKIATAEYEMPPWISQHATALLRAILQPNPAKRWRPHCPPSSMLWKGGADPCSPMRRPSVGCRQRIGGPAGHVNTLGGPAARRCL